jgi:hypothetical protein
MADNQEHAAKRALEILANAAFSTSVNAYVLSSDQREELLALINATVDGSAEGVSSESDQARPTAKKRR